MNSTVIIGYGWHLHISVISLHEAVQLYWHRLNTLNGVGLLGTFAGVYFAVQNQCHISVGKKKIYICGIDIA